MRYVRFLSILIFNTGNTIVTLHHSRVPLRVLHCAPLTVPYPLMTMMTRNEHPVTDEPGDAQLTSAIPVWWATCHHALLS